MNKIILTFLSVMALSVSYAEPRTMKAKRDVAQQTSPKEIQQRQKVREAILESVGGFVYDKRVAVGSVAVVDSQKKVTKESVIKHLSRIESVLTLKIKYTQVNTPIDFPCLDSALSAASGTVSVVLTDVAGLPALISLPEKRCVLVNIADLAKDGVAQEKVQERLMKEMSRAFCFAFVIGYCGAPGTVMDPITTLKELDSLLVDNVSVAQKMHVEKSSAKFFGMRPYKRVPYLKACQEGWAEKPTDKYQKAIWDKVHALPTEPIRILPESQKK